MSAAWRRHASTVLRVGAAVAILVLVWHVADGPQAIQALGSAAPGWLAVAFGMLLAHTVLAALRWKVTAGALGVTLSSREAISEYFLAQLLNSTLPGGVIGDAGRAVRSRHQVGLGAAAGAVAVERAIGQLALLTVLGVSLVAALVVPGGVPWPTALVVAVLVVIAALSMASVGVVVWIRRRRPGRATRVTRILDGLQRSTTAPGVLRRQITLSAGTVVCILAAFASCAAALGVPLPLAVVTTVVPLVLLAMLVPLSVGGWGVREGAAVALLPLAGVSSAHAFAMSAAFGIIALLAALPGLVALWWRRDRGARAAPPTTA